MSQDLKPGQLIQIPGVSNYLGLILDNLDLVGEHGPREDGPYKKGVYRKDLIPVDIFDILPELEIQFLQLKLKYPKYFTPKERCNICKR